MQNLKCKILGAAHGNFIVGLPRHFAFCALHFALNKKARFFYNTGRNNRGTTRIVQNAPLNLTVNARQRTVFSKTPQVANLKDGKKLSATVSSLNTVSVNHLVSMSYKIYTIVL